GGRALREDRLARLQQLRQLLAVLQHAALGQLLDSAESRREEVAGHDLVRSVRTGKVRLVVRAGEPLDELGCGGRVLRRLRNADAIRVAHVRRNAAGSWS